MSIGPSVFPGIPLVESPLFEAELPNMELSPAEREVAVSLNRNGFAVIDFPDSIVEERVERIKARLALAFGLSGDGSTDQDFAGNKRAQDAWEYDDDVRALAVNEQIISLLSRLYGRKAFPFQTLNFPIGTQQALHTDTVHFSSVPERFMCGVWLAMEDVDLDCGPLRYVPGSHQWPILTNSLIGRRGWKSELRSAQHPYEAAWRAMMKAKDAREETLLVRKGQALIWCANLLHGGSRRLDPKRTRWSQVTHYFFEDCVYYTPAYSDEPLGRLALREIVDVTDGRKVPNQYLGETLKMPHPWLRKSRRWLGKAREGWKALLPPSSVE